MQSSLSSRNRYDSARLCLPVFPDIVSVVKGRALAGDDIVGSAVDECRLSTMRLSTGKLAGRPP